MILHLLHLLSFAGRCIPHSNATTPYFPLILQPPYPPSLTPSPTLSFLNFRHLLPIIPFAIHPSPPLTILKSFYLTHTPQYLSPPPFLSPYLPLPLTTLTNPHPSLKLSSICPAASPQVDRTTPLVRAIHRAPDAKCSCALNTLLTIHSAKRTDRFRDHNIRGCGALDRRILHRVIGDDNPRGGSRDKEHVRLGKRMVHDSRCDGVSG